MNAILSVEFAYYHNVDYVDDGIKGRLFAPHVQGFLWGHSTRADRSELAASFVGGMGGSHGVHRKAIYDPYGAVSYTFKAPMYGYSFYRRRDGSYAHRAKALPLSRHYVLWEQLHNFSWPQMVFGVGDGEPILDAVWADLQKLWCQRARGWDADTSPFSPLNIRD